MHFNGVIEQRELNGQEEFKGKLYFAYADDVVFSKIDVRNGAIGVVPASMPCIAVSSEYPVYEVIQNVALPRYIQLLFKTAYFRQAINSMISGASGRKRVQPTQILDLAVPLPPKDTQQAIVALWQKVQEEAEASQNLLQNLSDNLNAILYSRYNLSNKDDALKSRSLGVNWKDVTAWDVKKCTCCKVSYCESIFCTFKGVYRRSDRASETMGRTG